MATTRKYRIALQLLLILMATSPRSASAFNFSSVFKNFAKSFGRAATNPNEFKVASKVSGAVVAKEIGTAKLGSEIHIPPQPIFRAAQQSYNSYDDKKKREKQNMLSDHILGMPNGK